MLWAMVALVSPLQDAGSPRADYDALNARLLAGLTATGVLQQWCDEHGVGAKVRAEVRRGAVREPDAAQRARLAVSADEPVAYRHVRLSCGKWLLSEAENWYVPSRLTPAMNAALAGGDTPFGAAIAALSPHRTGLGAELFWKPDAPMPDALFRHRALVLDSTGRPLAEVVETYQADALRLAANPVGTRREPR
jgi:chorismate-pyruvate lyase